MLKTSKLLRFLYAAHFTIAWSSDDLPFFVMFHYCLIVWRFSSLCCTVVWPSSSKILRRAEIQEWVVQITMTTQETALFPQFHTWRSTTAQLRRQTIGYGVTFTWQIVQLFCLFHLKFSFTTSRFCCCFFFNVYQEFLLSIQVIFSRKLMSSSYSVYSFIILFVFIFLWIIFLKTNLEF